jgi:hypothetical protein
MGPDPSDKSCKPPKFNVHQINASTSEIAQRQFCPPSGYSIKHDRMTGMRDKAAIRRSLFEVCNGPIGVSLTTLRTAKNSSGRGRRFGVYLYAIQLTEKPRGKIRQACGRRLHPDSD